MNSRIQFLHYLFGFISLIFTPLVEILITICIFFPAAVVRYNGLSFLYAVFLLICPLLRSPTPTSIRGKYVKVKESVSREMILDLAEGKSHSLVGDN